MQGASYLIARVATAGNLALSTADLRASVLGSIAPSRPRVGGDSVGGDSAARPDASGQVGGIVRALSGDEAGESRSGDEKGGVQHRVWRWKYQCLRGRRR